MIEADYDKWAEALLEEIYYAPEDQRVALIKKHLTDAAKRGYTEGTDSGWITARESCEHKSDGLVYCSNPPQNKCSKCGVFYREQETAVCQHDFQEMNPFREPSQMVCKRCGEHK